MNKINLQNVQFLMPNNFRKFPIKQEQFNDFEALQGLSRIFKFCTNSDSCTGVVCISRTFAIHTYSSNWEYSPLYPQYVSALPAEISLHLCIQTQEKTHFESLTHVFQLRQAPREKTGELNLCILDSLGKKRNKLLHMINNM
jgi:hypothetical protein